MKNTKKEVNQLYMLTDSLKDLAKLNKKVSKETYKIEVPFNLYNECLKKAK